VARQPESTSDESAAIGEVAPEEPVS